MRKFGYVCMVILAWIIGRGRKRTVNQPEWGQDGQINKEWEKMRKIQHNMKNQYVLGLGYLESGEYEKLKKLYMDNIKDMDDRYKAVQTGNKEIDMIINYKNALARQHAIELKTKIKLAGSEKRCAADIVTVLGNLFDNAIEACAYLPKKERWIYVEIVSDHTAVLIRMSNLYNKIVYGSDGAIITRKKDKRNHGIGLQTVEEIVNKHQGRLEINTEKGIFKITVFLHLCRH